MFHLAQCRHTFPAIKINKTVVQCSKCRNPVIHSLVFYPTSTLVWSSLNGTYF
jgi:hypothetical protein